MSRIWCRWFWSLTVMACFGWPYAGSAASVAGLSHQASDVHDQERPVVFDASFDPGIPPDGEVAAMARQADGRLLIAGYFFSVNGFPSRSIARLHPEGTVDESFSPHLSGGINGPIQALQLLADGATVIAGSFGVVQGYGLPGLARLHTNGTVDLTFLPHSSQIPSVIRALAEQPDGKLLIAGGSPYSSFPQLGRYLRNGAPDATFRIGPPGISKGDGFHVMSLLPDGKILVGGTFSQVDGLPRTGLVRFNADGSLDPSFEVLFSSPANDTVVVNGLLVQSDGKIVVAGKFAKVGGIGRPGMARLHTDGLLDITFDPGGGRPMNSSNVRALVAVPDGGVFWLGGGSPFPADPRSGIVRLNPVGNLEVAFNPGSDSRTLLPFANAAIVQPDGNVVTAGPGIKRLFGSSAGLRGLGFSSTITDRVDEGATLHVIVERLGDLDAGSLTATLSTRNGTAQAGQDFSGYSAVFTIPPQARTAEVSIPIHHDGKAELTETFTLELSDPGLNSHLSSPPRFNVAIADDDPPSVVDASFRPEKVGSGPIAVQLDGKILISGQLSWSPSDPPGSVFSTVWRLNPDGSLDRSFQQARLTNWVSVMASYPGGEVLVALVGSYYGIGAVSLSRLRADGSLDPAFHAPALPSFVELRDMAVRGDGKAIVATSAGIFVLMADGSLDPTFKLPYQIYPSAVDLQPDGRIVLHDNQPTIADYTSVQRHLSDGVLDPEFHAPVFSWSYPFNSWTDSITAIATAKDEAVFMAGDFTQIYGIRLLRLAKLQPNGVLNLDFSANEALYTQVGYPLLRDPEILSISAQPDGKVLLLMYRYGRVGYPTEGPIPGDSLLRLNPDGSLDGEFQFDRVFQGQAALDSMAIQPDGAILLNARSSAIWGNDSPRLIRVFGDSHGVSRIGFRTEAFTVGEPDGLPAIAVHREGDIGGSESVELRLSSGTATAGEDFAPFATLLQFAPFEVEKSVLLPIYDDPFGESDETCVGTLNSVVNSALNLSTATIAIADNDRPGGLDTSFSAGFPLPGPNETFQVSEFSLLNGGTIVAETILYNGQSWTRKIGFLGPDGSALAEFPGTDGQFTVAELAGESEADAYVWAYRENKGYLLQIAPDGTVKTAIAIKDASLGSLPNLSVLPLHDESFVVYGGRFLGRMLPDGSWDENFAATLTINGTIQTGVLDSENRVLVSGYSLVTEGSTNSFARINRDGKLDTSFGGQSTLTRGTESGWVYAIAVQNDGRILLGGRFDACGGVPRRNLARLNPDGSLDSSYDPGSALLPLEGLPEVRQIELQADGKALVRYTFYVISGPTSRLARLNVDGTVDHVFDFSVEGQLAQFALQTDGQILIGGDFSAVNGMPVSDLARLNGETPLRIHSIELEANGTARIVVAVWMGWECVLERSNDLSAWTSVSANVATSSRLDFADPGSADDQQRYYRVKRVQ